MIKELEEEKKRKELPELPDELCHLTNIKGAIKNNFSVYKMQEWTENILQKDIFHFKETICKGILSILDGTIQNDKIENACEANANIKKLGISYYIRPMLQLYIPPAYLPNCI